MSQLIFLVQFSGISYNRFKAIFYNVEKLKERKKYLFEKISWLQFFLQNNHSIWDIK